MGEQVSKSEHERICQLEEAVPQLRDAVTAVSNDVGAIRQSGVGMGLGVGVVPFVPDFASVLLAAIFIPEYRKRKTYGGGAKQVAHEEFNAAKDLDSKSLKNCRVHTAKKEKTVILTITHSDGTIQTWNIISGDLPDPPGNNTKKVTICYSSDGTPPE